MSGSTKATAEVRYGFGRNWKEFLKLLDEQRIESAEQSLQSFLGFNDLAEKSFLDIGSGSGLFSLAAYRLGARVRSFDYDADSVACTSGLRERFLNGAADRWIVEQGSVLDRPFVESLGRFDVVYSWGVLHHTGRMWTAIENAAQCVRPGGAFIIAIYNRHWTAFVWKQIKWIYNFLPGFLQRFMELMFVPVTALGVLISTGTLPKTYRGMDIRRDLSDWLGGYPYEYASVREMEEFVAKLGFAHRATRPTQGWTGCNEFVFERL